jgi:hypothetical protein
MSQTEPLARLPVGIVAERRTAKSAWADYLWRPVAALAGAPPAAPWTALGGTVDCMNFYIGTAEIELHRSDASGYRDNLNSGEPLLWVVLRSTGGEPPYCIAAVTAEPGEGEAYTEAGTDLVDTVAMPEPIHSEIAAFVAQHFVERPFVKRRRGAAS